jgi:hypothetical protein
MDQQTRQNLLDVLERCRPSTSTFFQEDMGSKVTKILILLIAIAESLLASSQDADLERCRPSTSTFFQEDMGSKVTKILILLVAIAESLLASNPPDPTTLKVLASASKKIKAGYNNRF